LGSAAAEPRERGVVARSRGVFIEKELGELILGGGIAGFGARFEFGDGGGRGGLLGGQVGWGDEAEKQAEAGCRDQGIGMTRIPVHGGPCQGKNWNGSRRLRAGLGELPEAAGIECKGGAGADERERIHRFEGAPGGQRMLLGPIARLDS